MTEYYQNSWFEEDRRHQASWFKRLIYFFGRPLLSVYARRYLSLKTLKTLNPSLVLPGRGMPLKTCRLWGSAFCNIREATVLVQGTGTGWDVLSWARLRPKKIIATDLFEFKESWDQIAIYCANSLGVSVEFRQSSLEDHSFLADASVDLCASDNVFEHCKDLRSVLEESFRILKPGGTLYAAYDPLWFCAGGDHFSGRGGLKNAFNHILLSQEDYQQYFYNFRQVNEDFQSGGRYVEIDLFSKLTTKDYCDLFQEAGFLIESLILGISPRSLAFKAEFPESFFDIVNKLKEQCTVDDLLIKANWVRLIKPN